MAGSEMGDIAKILGIGSKRTEQAAGRDGLTQAKIFADTHGHIPTIPEPKPGRVPDLVITHNKANEHLQLEETIGEGLNHAAKRAIALADSEEKPVNLKFNDVVVVVTPDATVSMDERIKSVREEYRDQCHRSFEAYSHSPEGRLAAQRKAEQVTKDQKKIDDLEKGLPKAIAAGEPSIVAWMGQYADIAANLDLKKNNSEIIQALQRAGYKSGYVSPLNSEQLERNHEEFAKWLVGGFMNDLITSGAPHSAIVTHFAEQYAELFGHH